MLYKIQLYVFMLTTAKFALLKICDRVKENVISSINELQFINNLLFLALCYFLLGEFVTFVMMLLITLHWFAKYFAFYYVYHVFQCEWRLGIH